MKRCPECRRDYYDDTLLYCLDDGNALLEGPATAAVSEPPASAGGQFGDEPQTAILHETAPPGEAATAAQIHTTEQTAVLSSDAAKVATTSGFDKRLLFAPLALAVIVLGGFFGYRYLTPAKQIESIAVMPFVNESGNADVEYLSDGMTETLISSLSNIPNLSVKARSTVFYYKGKQVSAKTIGEELNVQAVLFGRVSQRGDDLKLSMELVNTQTLDVIWSDQFDRKMSGLLSLQSEIAKQVSTRISSKLSGEDQKKVAKTYTNDPEAYQAYLKGRFYWNQRTADGLKKGIEYFQKAIQMDPGYALAWSGLADSYVLMPEYGSFPPLEYLPKGKEAALRSFELDPNLAEAQCSLAYVEHVYDWKFAEAEGRYKKAIELNPNYATAYQWYSEVLLQQRKFGEAQNAAKKAVELDPLSLIKNVGYGQSLFFARQYAEAEAVYRKVLEMKPEFAVANRQLARSLIALGKNQEGIDEAAKAYRSGGESFKYSQGVVYASAGDTQNANRFIAEYKDLDPRQAYDMTLIHSLRGEDEKALEGVEMLIKQRSVFVLYINIDPSMDAIRDKPRFKELMKQAGFTE